MSIDFDQVIKKRKKVPTLMYVPEQFRVIDGQTIQRFVADYPFAQLTSFDGKEPVVSHVPLIMERDQNGNEILTGHLARANSQWTHADGNTVLAIFSGPHAYISSSWYETDQSVPTWNYAAVHVYGTLQVLREHEVSRDSIQKLVQHMEGAQASWSIDLLEPDLFERLLQAIVPFEIKVDRVEAKFKLSQNHTPERRQRVISELSRRADSNSQGIAQMMSANITW